MSAEVRDHLDPDLVVDFVGGLLPAPRLDRVLDHASRCAACERLLQHASSVRERARATEREWLARDPIAPIPEPNVAPASVARETQARRPERRPGWIEWLLRPGLARPLAAAGALAAVAAMLAWPAISERRALERVHWLPGSEAEVTTRDPSAASPDKTIAAGLEAYARHDLDAAREWLSKTRGRGQIELVRRIYLANVLAQQGDHQDAIVLLETVPFDLVPEPWSGESRWTLAASLRARGDRQRADSLIEGIAQEPGPVGDRARALLPGR